METTPSTVLTEALHEAGAHDDFTRLSPDDRLLVLSAVLAYGRESLLTGNSAAEHAGRLIAAVTGSSRLGAATARAVRKWAGAVDELTAEEQALHEHFRALPLPQRLRLLRLLHHWEQAPPTRRAMAAKLLDEGLPTKVVAWLCGVTDRTLRRHRPYQEFARQLRRQGNRPPRGAKDRGGEIEAWGGDE